MSIQYAFALAFPRFGSKGGGASMASVPWMSSRSSFPPTSSGHARGRIKSPRRSFVWGIAASLKCSSILQAKSSGQSCNTTLNKKIAACLTGWGAKKSWTGWRVMHEPKNNKIDAERTLEECRSTLKKLRTLGPPSLSIDKNKAQIEQGTYLFTHFNYNRTVLNNEPKTGTILTVRWKSTSEEHAGRSDTTTNVNNDTSTG